MGVQRGRQDGQAVAGCCLGVSSSLCLRLLQWDARPWTDVPDRLERMGVQWASGEAEAPCGTLIITRWLEPVTLRRVKALVTVSPTPVLLCTAAPSALCGAALDLGVADIVRADMHDGEVLARLSLRCLTERAVQGAGAAAQAQWLFGPLLLDRMQRLAWLNGRRLRVTPLQFDVLAALIMAKGAVVAAETLREAVWHTPHDPGTNRLAVHMFHLRRAMEDAGGGLAVRAEGGGYALFLQQPA